MKKADALAARRNASDTHKRLLRLQRQMLLSIRAEVRHVMGPQPASLTRYYEAYKREFRGLTRNSSKAELLEACARSKIILIGDYHPFPQSQRAALRLLRELVEKNPKITIALEMFPSAVQKDLDAYVSGYLSEQEFLEQIDYPKIWGFPWRGFKPLLEFARKHRLKVLALNLEEADLNARDEHAADILSRAAVRSPKNKFFVLYGDLHLARNHIPKKLKQSLREYDSKSEILTIFQNSESLYWKLASQKQEHEVDVVRLSMDRFCVMNAAPWVKLLSYLQWAETGETIDDEELPDSSARLHEMMNDRLSNLVVALGFKSPPRIPEYTIRTSSNLSFLERAGRLNTQDLRMLRRHVATSKTLWMTNVKTLYLSSEGINSLCEGAALILHASLSRFKRLDAQVDFFGATVAEAVAYFLSKLLNPRRKCDLEADFEHVVQRGIDSRALPGERRAFTAAKSVLAHCRAQRSFLDSGTYRTPAGAPEVSRALGQILGERLHTAYLAGAFSTDKARVLLRKPIKNPRESRKLYLDLLNDLANIEPARRSKKAWL